MALSDVKIRNAKPAAKPYKLFDGGCMFLAVNPSGSKCWRLKYFFLGRERLISLGQYPLIGLADARQKRDEVKKSLIEGIDPALQRQTNRQRGIVASESAFEAVARRWHEIRRGTEIHKIRCLRRLEIHVFPKLGSRAIQDITTMDIAICLEDVESHGILDTAHRVKQLFQQVFRYAVRRGLIVHNPAADLRDILAFPKKQNFASIHPSELPDLLRAINNYRCNGLTIHATKFLALTFVRTGELLGARWDEIDWARSEWHIPAERMKMKRPHVVPLARQTLALLEEIKTKTGKLPYIFYAGSNKEKHMSNGAILSALKRMGYNGRMTGHGFRSLASTILNEQRKYHPDAIEKQLAHSDRNEIRAAYNRADYLIERKAMMQDWADFLDNTANNSNNVLVGRFGTDPVPTALLEERQRPL
jgi:integrase